MNRDMRKTKNVSHEISKQRAYANVYDAALMYNTTQGPFKMQAHSLACTTPSRRLDRLRPPPLDLVSNLQPLMPMVICAMNTATFEFLNTQPSFPPSQSSFPLEPLPPLPQSSLQPPSFQEQEQESIEVSVADLMQKFKYQQQENISSPVLATSSSWSIDYPNSPTSPTLLFYPNFVSSPTTGLMKNMN